MDEYTYRAPRRAPFVGRPVETTPALKRAVDKKYGARGPRMDQKEIVDGYARWQAARDARLGRRAS